MYNLIQSQNRYVKKNLSLIRAFIVVKKPPIPLPP